jgi:hypothetical protein
MRSFSKALLFSLSLSLSACAAAPIQSTGAKSPEATNKIAKAKPKTPDRAEWRARLAERRKIAIQRLHDYWVAGVFPQNRTQNVMQRVFRDDAGRLCAMANLIHLSGDDKLVDATAKNDNFVFLGDVKSGPLMDWMLTSGLTQEEIAFVQEPDFVYQEAPAAVDLEQQRLRAHFQQAENWLTQNTDKSLDTAVDRLMPRLAAGDIPLG